MSKGVFTVYIVSNSAALRVFQVPVQGANVYNKNAGKGGWGGQCTCADGQVYQVRSTPRELQSL